MKPDPFIPVNGFHLQTFPFKANSKRDLRVFTKFKPLKKPSSMKLISFDISMFEGLLTFNIELTSRRVERDMENKAKKGEKVEENLEV